MRVVLGFGIVIILFAQEQYERAGLVKLELFIVNMASLSNTCRRAYVQVSRV